MARFQEPAKQSDFLSAMISDVSETIVPPNSVALAVNLDFDVILGAATSRPGTTQVGSQLVDNKVILGLHQHTDPTDSGNNLLFGALNVSGDTSATIKNVATGANVVTGLAANTRVRFFSYSGETIALNGVDAPRAWNNSSWITTGGVFDLGDWPANESSLVIEFLDRIYANDETVPYRVHYSTLFDGSAITWNGDYIDLEPDDQGGKLTAFAKVPGYVLFFKERSMHRWNFSSAFPESLVNLGTPHQECVVESGGLVFFYSNSDEDARGFYVTNGGRPQNISKDTTRSIRRFIDAIPSGNEANICAGGTDRVVWWSVGDLTVDGETHTNVVLRYNRVLNQWSVRSYPTEFRVFAKYLVSGVNSRVGGDDDGNVFQYDVADTYQDNGTDISWTLRTHHESYNTNRLKTITDQVIVRGKHLIGMAINLIPDEDLTKRVALDKKPKWVRKILSFMKTGKTVKAATLAVELKGETTEARAVIKEIELPDIDVKENYES